MKSIGEQIRERRLEAGLTQAALADLIRSGQSRIGEYERGDRLPNVSTLQELAAVLGPFELRGALRSAQNWKELFESSESVTTKLVARAIHGLSGRPVREVHRELQELYGESLTGEQALAQLDQFEAT